MKRILLSTYIVFSIFILVGCSGKQAENVSLEIWHYYNGTQKIIFDELIEDFNETIGMEKGIIVEAFNQGNINQLEDIVVEYLGEELATNNLPNMITTYPELAYLLDQEDMLTNLEDYLTKGVLDEYIESYIEEGRMGKDKQLKIFPTAKSTEVMMINKTDWDPFAAATGARLEDLETWEGVSQIAKLYYQWTDSLTEETDDGKAFFGRDALANYILVGSKQLGQEIFQVSEENEDQVLVNLDSDAMRRLWDNYYIPYISGYYTSYGRFSTDDAKTGEIIALIGSTAGAPYFPSDVTIGDKEPYPIDLLVLPLPNFKDAGFNAVQQGAGISVLKKDKAHEQASVEFLRWFTQESSNLKFAIKTGYLPVKKEAYKEDVFNKVFEEKIEKGLVKQLEKTMPLARDQVGKYELSSNKVFKQNENSRNILENSLEDKAKEDREKVLALIKEGKTHEEAVESFSTDANFQEWLKGLEQGLRGAIK